MLKKTFMVALLAASLSTTAGLAGAREKAEKININTASVEVLDKQLKYVGKKTAKRIVAYRKAHGPFNSVDDLNEVHGIGTRVLKANWEKLVAE
ncbi:MAG: helix-hairpin-helix domain-containing protein [Kistimonas sp.]|nr:helix-hairpin-helix domain-containing protein [Kistimonas sp.]